MDKPLSYIIPKEYGYVLLSLTSTFILTAYHSSMVTKTRKAAGVAYPRPYAESTWELPSDSSASGKNASAADLAQRRAEYRFNCAQRAHGNLLEQMPIFIPALLVSGLRWPVASASLGACFVVSRFVYMYGYIYGTQTKGSSRLYGFPYVISILGLIGMTGKMGFDIAFA